MWPSRSLDIDGTLDAGGITDSTLIKTNRPFVSIFKSSDALYGKIFQQTGPSQYVNRTNVQRMDGYDAASTGLSYDFGACHSTWFNPVRYGYDCNVIATIEVTTATVDGVAVKNYDIRQHVVGSICLNTPLSYLGSTLFDYPGVTEADDPYNDNETNGFNQVCNYGIRSSLNTISPITTASSRICSRLPTGPSTISTLRTNAPARSASILSRSRGRARLARPSGWSAPAPSTTSNQTRRSTPSRSRTDTSGSGCITTARITLRSRLTISWSRTERPFLRIPTHYGHIVIRQHHVRRRHATCHRIALV